jgi:Competence protein CoiA-like family
LQASRRWDKPGQNPGGRILGNFRQAAAYAGCVRPHGDALTRFEGREERRQLFARDARLPADAPLVFMPEGGADSVRQDCRDGYLVCPVPDRPNPRYIARGGSRRHHFAHHGGAGGHAPERYFHQVGKRLVADLIRKRQPRAEVVLEGRVENGQVADVLARSPATGRRYAFEVQYSPLTVEEWRARHDGYRALGIVDTWLFGHIRPHLRRVPGSGLIAVSPLLAEVFREGLAVLFLNPDEQTVGTALLGSHLATLDGSGELRGLPGEAPPLGTALAVEPLGIADVDGRGLLTAATQRLRAAEARQGPRRREHRRQQFERDLTRPEPPERAPTIDTEELVERLRLEREAREHEETTHRRARLAKVKAELAASDPTAAARFKALKDALRRRR